jgi:single-strand DNA-binding protein
MMTIQGVGRLGADPKMQYTPQGTALTNMSVAVDCGFGENKETVWVSLVSFGKQAEILNQHLSKGRLIHFVAEVTKNRTYEKQNGIGVSLDAKVLTFSFLDANNKSNEPEEF